MAALTISPSEDYDPMGTQNAGWVILTKPANEHMVRVWDAVRRCLICLFLMLSIACGPAHAEWHASGTGTNHGSDFFGAAHESLVYLYGQYQLKEDGINTKFGYNTRGEATSFQDCGWFAEYPFHVLCAAATQTCSTGIGTIVGCVTTPVSYQGCPGRCTTKPSEVVGEPINAASGNLFETASDFSTVGADPLTATRYYNSDPTYLSSGILAARSRFGGGWRSEYDLQVNQLVINAVDVIRPNGAPVRFQLVSGAYKLAYYNGSSWVSGRVDIDLRLSKDATYWYVKDENDTVEQYNISDGKLVSITYRDGYQKSFTYDASGNNTVVSDSFSRQLIFAYGTNGLVSSMTDPTGNVTQYTYVDRSMSPTPPAPGQPGMSALSTVQFQDSTSLTYLYEDTLAINHFALTGITDQNGNRYATWTFDSNGRATSSQFAGGAGLTSISFDTVGSQSTVTNALGKQEIYGLSGAQGVSQINSIAGQASAHTAASTMSYSYDSNGFVSQITDGNGNVTKYTNNAIGQVTSETDGYGSPVARTINTTWNSTWREPDQIVEPNITRDFTYDGNGRLTQLKLTDTTATTVPYSTNGQTRIWGYTYYASGLLNTVDGPLAGTGDTTTYVYDASGFVNSITDVLGHTTTIASNNGRGEPLSSVDANGITTNYAYDLLGRITDITVNPGANQAVYGFTYDNAGNLTVVTRPDSSSLTYAYDNAHRVTSVTNNLGESVTYTLDALGGRTATVTRSASSTVTKQESATFDELGRVLTNIGAASQTTSHAYDLNNNETSTTDPRSKVYGHAFDALNRLYQETDPDLFHTTSAFNAQDNPVGVTDARSLTTTYIRNGFGDIIRRSSPDTGITDFWVDANGMAVKQVDARQVETDFTNDAAGRVLTRTYPSASPENVTYTYDATAGGNKGVGQLTSVSDQSGSSSFTYDALGRVITDARIIGAQSYSTGYTYDAAGNILTATYPSGRIVTYTRDVLGRISGITTKQNAGASAVTVASGVSYKPFGPLAGLTFGNGVVLAQSLDQDYQLVGISAANGVTTIQNLTNGFDPAGNITSITDGLTSGRSQTVTYDNLNRVLTASGIYGSQTYAYDGVGNRQSLAAGSTSNYTYAATANQIASITNMVPPATGSGNYLYNAFRQRVQKVAGGTTTQFVYDQAGHLLEEADGSGTVQREYIWLDDMPVAMVDSTGAPTLYFIHADQLGTPQKLTDGAMSVVWDGVFDPFGNPASGASLAKTNLRFPGQYFDAETSLNQNWNRDYDPATGRYIQSDPIGLKGGTNTYEYALSNPLLYSDETGLAPNRGPGSARCAKLAQTIKNIERDIAKRKQDIARNPLKLPMQPPYLGAPPRMSVQGHQDIIQDLQKVLAKRRQEYKTECDCGTDGDPPSGTVPVPSPGPIPIIPLPGALPSPIPEPFFIPELIPVL